MDAEAIWEAATYRPMRFVAMKSIKQQAVLSVHRARPAGQQCTQLVNTIRGLLAEFGIDLPKCVERALRTARQTDAKEAEPDVP